MTEFVLYGIIILALATFYVGIKKPGRLLFDKVCDAFLLFSSLNASYVIIIRIFFDSGGITDAGSPFILGYGAFFFMGLKALTDGELKMKCIYLHYSPLILFTLVYIVIMSSEVLREKYFITYYVVLYAVSILSLICYTLIAIFSSTEDATDIVYREKKQLVRVSGFALGAMALLFIATAITGLFTEEGIKDRLPGTILYAGLFVSIAAAFVYRINNLIEDVPGIARHVENATIENLPTITATAEPTSHKAVVGNNNQKGKENVLDTVPLQKYNKSALSAAVLTDYKIKLNNLIDTEKVYLDNELTLESLSKKMKMPMHHLTQLFNVHLGENFNQYINRFRIEYACRLLENNDGSMSIEQIAFNSGFNSKVSFNRHFKNITGVTPKEYAYTAKNR